MSIKKEFYTLKEKKPENGQRVLAIMFSNWAEMLTYNAQDEMFLYQPTGVRYTCQCIAYWTEIGDIEKELKNMTRERAIETINHTLKRNEHSELKTEIINILFEWNLLEEE